MTANNASGTGLPDHIFERRFRVFTPGQIKHPTVQLPSALFTNSAINVHPDHAKPDDPWWDCNGPRPRKRVQIGPLDV